MKKFATILLILALVFSLSGCKKFIPNFPWFSNDNQISNEVETTNDDHSEVDTSNENESSNDVGSTVESGSDETSTIATDSESSVDDTNSSTEVDKPTEPSETSTEHVHDFKPVYKTVHHDAEYKTVHHEAQTHTVHHDAEYKTVHHDAEYQTIHHDAEYKTEKTIVSYTVQHQYARFVQCDEAYRRNFDPYDYNYVSSAYKQALKDYRAYLDSIGQPSNYSNSLLVSHTLSVDFYNSLSWTFDVVTPNYETTQVLVHEAYDETVLVHEAYDEQVLVKAAWDETIVDKAAWDETVLVKAAYDEQVIDHYECECGERK